MRYYNTIKRLSRSGRSKIRASPARSLRGIERPRPTCSIHRRPPPPPPPPPPGRSPYCFTPHCLDISRLNQQISVILTYMVLYMVLQKENTKPKADVGAAVRRGCADASSGDDMAE
ncbi:unnamed protein product [Plutella xylostella]|uniref:(diamondback moth) hypothetical protein n=1 Tax=Plutella xylostella TaxID=51655 RepID=A0A8S4G0J0_PLUXY|nr:unnamed protein product [Plutella xylostella]